MTYGLKLSLEARNSKILNLEIYYPKILQVAALIGNSIKFI